MTIDSRQKHKTVRQANRQVGTHTARLTKKQTDRDRVRGEISKCKIEREGERERRGCCKIA